MVESKTICKSTDLNCIMEHFQTSSEVLIMYYELLPGNLK